MFLRIVCLTLLVYTAASQGVAKLKTGVAIIDFSGPFPSDKLVNKDEALVKNSNITFDAKHAKGTSFPKLVTLDIENCHFSDIPEGTVRAFPNLEKLIIKATIKEKFRLMGLNRIPSLKYLEVDDIPMKTLGINSFSKLTSLKTLTLNSNSIEDIKNKAFEGLDKLEVLTLKKNNLKDLKAEVLKPLKNLRELYLNHNNLAKFGPENLPPLPELRKIDLGYNPIDNVDVEGLKKLAPKLEDVTIGASE